jgi:hypothetical protein
MGPWDQYLSGMEAKVLFINSCVGVFCACSELSLLCVLSMTYTLLSTPPSINHLQETHNQYSPRESII